MAFESGKIYVGRLLFGWFVTSLFISLTFAPAEVSGCNEAVCASVVSKCMLTQSCKCDLKNCSCCKECFNCLSFLYSECCSCVDMCPRSNETNGDAGSSLGRKSHVEEFSETLPELFQALMSEPDAQQRWVTYTFPVDLDISPYFRPKLLDKEIKFRTHRVIGEELNLTHITYQILTNELEMRKICGKMLPDNLSQNQKDIRKERWLDFLESIENGPHFLKGVITESAEQDVATPDAKEVMTINCTVAYMSQCMSWNKCRSSCQSTGASSYRWFHDGCCECIGSTCINYGLNESRLLLKPDYYSQTSTFHPESMSMQMDTSDEQRQQLSEHFLPELEYTWHNSDL
ncbi:hypothetical protein J437_LFUL013402 [Ladona fulva]|uniref:Protein twisted gastrulation n=1 Tax=Ladona fulva TaxID=123851 RepID=A0A8K0KDU1_LADFU|nr:hypothetical protein J437_LFUL013402 [Ladona fulva]